MNRCSASIDADEFQQVSLLFKHLNKSRIQQQEEYFTWSGFMAEYTIEETRHADAAADV